METMDQITSEINKINHPALSLEDKSVIVGKIKRVGDGYFLGFDGNSSVVFQSRRRPKGVVIIRRRDFHGAKEDPRVVELLDYNTSRGKLNSLCREKMVEYIEENLRLNAEGRVYHTDFARVEWQIRGMTY